MLIKTEFKIKTMKNRFTIKASKAVSCANYGAITDSYTPSGTLPQPRKKTPKIAQQSEKNLHRQVCEYLRIKYPATLYNSDMSGVRLTKGQAITASLLRSNKGFPDLAIYEPRGGYHCLFIVLKREGDKLYKKSGDWATDHLREQAECMRLLKSKGYACHFAIGFDEAVTVIDAYLKQGEKLLSGELF
jgi:hypothetical protein